MYQTISFNTSSLRKLCLDKAVKEVHSREKIITAFGMSSCGFFFLSVSFSYTVEELCLARLISSMNVLKKFVVNGRTCNFLSRKT